MSPLIGVGILGSLHELITIKSVFWMTSALVSLEHIQD